MYGYVGLCRAMYGYVWLCRAMYGYVGLFRRDGDVGEERMFATPDPECIESNTCMP